MENQDVDGDEETIFFLLRQSFYGSATAQLRKTPHALTAATVERLLDLPDQHTPGIARWLITHVPELIPAAYHAYVLEVADVSPVEARRFLSWGDPEALADEQAWYERWQPYLYLPEELPAVGPALSVVLSPDLARYVQGALWTAIGSKL